MSNKRQQWALIQDQAPDLAEFLVKINAVFGKPAGIDVKLASGERIKSGEICRSLGFNFDEESDR
ncbi:MAG: hypothetical protein WCL60_01250 [Methylococcales bacterium]